MANAKKYDPRFMELFKRCARLDPETGNLRFEGLYVSAYLNVGWEGSVISIPFSHAVWFLTHGQWPREGYLIDHINDDPMDNRPSNHQELDHHANQAKRRGRMIYRSYGKGKYGYGLYINHDKRDGRFYITRTMSRGHGEGDLKTVKHGLAAFDTLEAAEKKVTEYIEQIKLNGLDYLPEHEKRPSYKTVALKEKTDLIRSLRTEGRTLQEIADMTGFSIATISKKTQDIHVPRRRRK